MRSTSILAAAATVAYVAVSVEAGGKWRAPRETQTAAAAAAAAAPGELAYMAQIGLPASPALDDAPATTAPATLADRFWERTNRDNTCAYLYGNATDSLYCSTNSACVVNTDLSMVGCCADTSSVCTVYTTCYPAASSAKYTTNSLTLFCNDATYSECVTHYYVDSIYTGYTLLGCGKTAAVDNVYYQPTSDFSSSSSSSSLKKTTSTPTSTPTSSPTTSSSTSTTPATAATTKPASHTNHAKHKKGGSSGAIAGGVVGGVAALSLIGAGIMYLLRRNKNKANSAEPPAAGAPGAPGAPDASGTPDVPPSQLPGQAPGQTPMAQNGYYNGAPSGDVAAAGAGAGAAGVVAYHQVYGQPGQQQDAKLYDPYMSQLQQPHDPAHTSTSLYTTAASPLGSPATTQSPPDTAVGTPEPVAVSAQHTGSPQSPVAPFTAPAPAPGMGFHSGPVPASLSELPTERGHGNVQELA